MASKELSYNVRTKKMGTLRPWLVHGPLGKQQPDNQIVASCYHFVCPLNMLT